MMRKRLYLALSLTSVMLFAGCSLVRGGGEPSPTPQPFPTAEPTPSPTATSPPIKRIALSKITEHRYYSVGTKKIGVAIVNENGQALLPVREWANACIALKLKGKGFTPVWSYTNRNISLEKRIESGCLLLGQTGYIELSQAVGYLPRDSIEIDEQLLTGDRNFRQ